MSPYTLKIKKKKNFFLANLQTNYKKNANLKDALKKKLRRRRRILDSSTLVFLLRLLGLFKVYIYIKFKWILFDFNLIPFTLSLFS